MSQTEKKRTRSETSSISFSLGAIERSKKSQLDPSISESNYSLNKIEEINNSDDKDENDDDDLFLSDKEKYQDSDSSIQQPRTTRLRNRQLLRSVDLYDENRRPSTSSTASTKTKTLKEKNSKPKSQVNKSSFISKLDKIKKKKISLEKKGSRNQNNNFARGRGGQNLKTQEIIEAHQQNQMNKKSYYFHLSIHMLNSKTSLLSLLFHFRQNYELLITWKMKN